MKTYKGRTEAEQRLFNQQRKDEYKRKQELKLQGVEVEEDDNAVEIDTESIQPPLVPSFKEKMLAHFKPDAKTEESKAKPVDKNRVAKSENLLSNTLPLMLSGLLALNAERIFKEPYKVCAPTKEEVSSILFPIFSVVSRHVEIEGKASQDALDIGAACVAAITVGCRVAITKIEVDNYVKEQSRSTEQSGNIHEIIRANERFVRNSQAATNGTAYNPSSSNGTGTNGSGINVGYGNGSHNNDGYADGPTEADLVSQLMRKERAGRAKIGLAPPAV